MNVFFFLSVRNLEASLKISIKRKENEGNRRQ